MDKTGYAIAQAKFYGYKPDDNIMLKQASKQFYGHNPNNSTKPGVKAYSRYGDNEENVSRNVQRGRRDSFTDAGTKILKSQAMEKQPDVIPHSNLSTTVIKKPMISPTNIDYT